MSRIATAAAIADELAVTAEPGSPGRTILVLGGLALVLVVFAAVSVVARALTVVVTAAVAAVSTTFALLGRTLGIGLIGLLVAGVALWGGSSSADQQNPTPVAPAPPAAAPG